MQRGQRARVDHASPLWKSRGATGDRVDASDSVYVCACARARVLLLNREILLFTVFPRTLQLVLRAVFSSSMWKCFPKRAAGCCRNIIYVSLKVDSSAHVAVIKAVKDMDLTYISAWPHVAPPGINFPSLPNDFIVILTLSMQPYQHVRFKSRPRGVIIS